MGWSLNQTSCSSAVSCRAVSSPSRAVRASCRRGDEVVWEREISDGGEVLHPVILAHGGAIWYAWSEYARENWRILARCYRDGQWGEVLTVASGEAHVMVMP